jgi:hypothetical protein
MRSPRVDVFPGNFYACVSAFRNETRPAELPRAVVHGSLLQNYPALWPDQPCGIAAGITVRISVASSDS